MIENKTKKESAKQKMEEVDKERKKKLSEILLS